MSSAYIVQAGKLDSKEVSQDTIFKVKLESMKRQMCASELATGHDLSSFTPAIIPEHPHTVEFRKRDISLSNDVFND